MRRIMATVAAAAVAVGAGVALVGQAQAEEKDPAPELELLPPTGEYPVGVTQLHLVDGERADPWVPGEDRELMVSVWYPAKRDGGDTVQYLTDAESRLFLEQEEVDLPPDALTKVGTHARPDAKPARGKKRPLVLLSPGGNKPRATLSGLAEELASNGYVVAAIGHNYETVTEFPDGHVTQCEACGSPDIDKAVSVRSADARFVLDELTGRRSGWRGADLIDKRRIAMAGHSRGGAAAYMTMTADKRVKAAINMDGSMRDPAETPYDRPLLLLGNQYSVPSQDTTWDDEWQLGSGWKRWITVEGTAHASFTDIGLLGPQAGLEHPGQTLAPERCMELTREVVTAFFDRHLRGADRPILDGPSDDDPELVFHSP